MIAIEILGYIGMVFVLASFFMKEAIFIRLVNIIGALLSMIYGILTVTIPTACLNAALLTVNVIFVLLYYKKKKEENKKSNDQD